MPLNKKNLKNFNKDLNFVLLSQYEARDKRLSFKARGLFAYLCSNSSDWNFYVKELANHSNKDGKGAIRSAIKELEKYGYLKRHQIKNGKSGQFTNKTRWTLYYIPDSVAKKLHISSDNPKVKKPLYGKTDVGSLNANNHQPKQSLSKTSIKSSKGLEVRNQKTHDSPKMVSHRIKTTKIVLMNIFPNDTIPTSMIKRWVNNYSDELIYKAIRKVKMLTKRGMLDGVHKNKAWFINNGLDVLSGGHMLTKHLLIRDNTVKRQNARIFKEAHFSNYQIKLFKELCNICTDTPTVKYIKMLAKNFLPENIRDEMGEAKKARYQDGINITTSKFKKVLFDDYG